MAKPKPTYAEQARNYGDWQEYMDPDGLMTRDEFEGMSEEDKVRMIVEAFGAETIDCEATVSGDGSEVPDERDDARWTDLGNESLLRNGSEGRG